MPIVSLWLLEVIIESVRNYLKKVQKEGFVIKFGVIFGSQVTGQAGRWSDIDLLVVSPRFDGSRDKREGETATLH